MSQASCRQRCFEPITKRDLRTLARIALKDNPRFFRRHPKHVVFRDRLLGIALAQGAARHYLKMKGSRGINDFDLYMFFAAVGGRRGVSNRRPKVLDCGIPRFGPDPAGRTRNRRIDLFRKTAAAADLRESILRWLQAGGQQASHVVRNPFVEIWPRCGITLWSP